MNPEKTGKKDYSFLGMRPSAMSNEQLCLLAELTGSSRSYYVQCCLDAYLPVIIKETLESLNARLKLVPPPAISMETLSALQVSLETPATDKPVVHHRCAMKVATH